ncbi:MAG: hypothetical protein KF901_32610 [Myxococcales bacterium]|nr:hypothetical protein [Myxococcales bacterium]
MPVVVARVTECEWDASFPDDTRVLDATRLEGVLDRLLSFVHDLVTMDPQDESQAERVRSLLAKHQLAQDQFLNAHTTRLGKKRRPKSG